MRVCAFSRFDLHEYDADADLHGHQKFNKLLESIDWSGILHVQFTPDLQSVAIIYEKEVRIVNRKEHDAGLETINKPVDLSYEKNMESLEDLPVETPLGEEIDGGDEIEDQDGTDDPQQPSLFEDQ